MTATLGQTRSVAERPTLGTGPRFGGVLWRLARLTSPVTLPLAGKRWNPIFAVVEHQGRRTGRRHVAPVAARRTEGGFVISLAFGAQVDWFKNLLAAGRGVIRWRGQAYRVTAPEPITTASALAAFNLVQRVALRIGGVDGYVQVRDLGAGEK